MGIKKIMILKSPAKLNLFLNITKKRNDNYHDIETYFQLISLYDKVSLELIPGSKIKFNTNIDSLCNNDNLCVQAAELLRAQLDNKLEHNVSIKLSKNIPIGGGLGGGSSNAASVLLGLNKLWGCNLPTSELSRLAAKLGSDVPVFIDGFSSYGEGTGCILTKHQYEKKYFLVIFPGFHVSSEYMYSKYKIKDCIKRINLDNMHQNIGFNSFEDLLCIEHPEIKDLLGLLRKKGNGSVSGSGSCVFSMFDDEISATNAIKTIPSNYQTYIVHSLI